MTQLAMPAEWELHDAVWTAWPYDREQWAEGLDAPRASLASMSAAIVDVDPDGAPRGERVELLIADAAHEAQARELLGAAAVGVRFHVTSYGDVWLRDTGPLFLWSDAGERVAACFRFDGWGGKYVMDGDTEVNRFVAGLTGDRTVYHHFVLEGGAVEVDGAGTVLTTKQCLLDGARNPGLSQQKLEQQLRYALGVTQVIWLDRGLINDHTDGHIDTIARFVAPGVVACMEPSVGDPNRDAMNGIIADLRTARDANGRALEIITVPSPGAVFDKSGELMPASYMNFYIANSTLVVPTYGAVTDDEAVAKLATCFPTRRAVAVSCKPVVVGGGGFHCCTQQQPTRGHS